MYWLQIFTVILFQLYAKDDFDASLQWHGGFSHREIHICTVGHRILPKLNCQNVVVNLLKLCQSFSGLFFSICPVVCRSPALRPAVSTGSKQVLNSIGRMQLPLLTVHWLPGARSSYVTTTLMSQPEHYDLSLLKSYHRFFLFLSKHKGLQLGPWWCKAISLGCFWVG